jgi:tetrahydromethanopterin S-methyltransferase subunit F
MSSLLEYQLRIRNASNTADALTITSVIAGTNPWLSTVPNGDGQSFDPLTGASFCGAFTGRICDGITSGTDRVVTSQLEDVNYRQQLMDRRAFLEYRVNGGSWTVLIAGFLTALRLVSGIEYEYEISDPTRAENDYTAFKPQTAVLTVAAPGAAGGATSLPCDALAIGIASGTVLNFGAVRAVTSAAASAGATSVSVTALASAVATGLRAGYTESVASFITRWPNRGCILGGPVRGGFLGQPDRGGWEMVVDSRQGVGVPTTYLRFVAGYAPPSFERSTNAEECGTAVNAKTDNLSNASPLLPSTDSVTTFAEALCSLWPGVILEIVGYGYYVPSTGDLAGFAGIEAQLATHLFKDIRKRGIFCRTPALGTGGFPAANTSVRVRAFTAEVSELSPIFWTGHPADLFATLFAEAGIDYSSSSVTTTKQAVGSDRRIALIITEPKPLAPFLTSLRAAFGIGVRQNSSGQVELFPSRIQYNAVPATTIGNADVQTDANGSLPEIFAVDRASAIKRVIFEHTRLVLSQMAFDEQATYGFVSQTERFERTNGDGSAVGNGEASFTVPGMMHTADSNAPDISGFVDAFAREVFDRWGRGVIRGSIAGLRGGSTDSLSLGDECLHDLDVLPNHNKRLGDDISVAARAMQVVKRTWTPRGFLLDLLDSGPNNAPYATVPTHTIAASTALPRTVAELTITNASTLNAAMAGIRIQMAVTTGSAPAATDYVDVAAYDYGKIPTTAITLPAVVAGRKVYARAAATSPTFRPSSWQTAVSVTLSSITAPSAFAAAAGADGSLEQLTWTVGDSTMLTDVYLRASGAPSSDAVRQITLDPGSARYLQESLTPSTAYTSSVQHRDKTTGDVSALVDVTYTTSATVTTLQTPLNPQPFAGTRDGVTGIPQRDGIYGVAVYALEFPGFIEVDVAVETSIGAGTYGAFVTSGTRIPSIPGDWTAWTDIAPNDGLRRLLKVRHARTGATSSSYTSNVTVTPWTPTALPPYSSGLAPAIHTGHGGDRFQRQRQLHGGLPEYVRLVQMAGEHGRLPLGRNHGVERNDGESRRRVHLDRDGRRDDHVRTDGVRHPRAHSRARARAGRRCNRSTSAART